MGDPHDQPVVRELVGPDGTVHRAVRTASSWAASDDPEQPVGATGFVTTGCGQLLRPTQVARTSDCPFCRQAADRLVSVAVT